MSFDLVIRAGGYWSTDDKYLGGEPHTVGLMSADTFKLSMVIMLIVEHLGYEDNMKKVSWFPPETPEEKEDIDTDDVLQKVIHYALGSGLMTLYVVREDDPYIGRHIDDNAMRYLSEDDTEGVLGDEGVLAGEDGGGSESDNGGDENQFEDLVYSSSDDDTPLNPGRPQKNPEGASSSQPTSVLGSESQPYEDLPSLSSALPRKCPGRPCKHPKGASFSQPAPQRQEPMYDTWPMYLPRADLSLIQETTQYYQAVFIEPENSKR